MLFLVTPGALVIREAVVVAKATTPVGEVWHTLGGAGSSQQDSGSGVIVSKPALCRLLLKCSGWSGHSFTEFWGHRLLCLGVGAHVPQPGFKGFVYHP